MHFLGLHILADQVYSPFIKSVCYSCFFPPVNDTASCREQVSGENMQLSEEQLHQIEQNRRAALERLARRNVPVPVGESWRKKIGTEFTKPYFTKVSDTQCETLSKQQ